MRQMIQPPIQRRSFNRQSEPVAAQRIQSSFTSHFGCSTQLVELQQVKHYITARNLDGVPRLIAESLPRRVVSTGRGTIPGGAQARDSGRRVARRGQFFVSYSGR